MSESAFMIAKPVIPLCMQVRRGDETLILEVHEDGSVKGDPEAFERAALAADLKGPDIVMLAVARLALRAQRATGEGTA